MPDWMGTGGNTGATAPYPAANYPFKSFMGGSAAYLQASTTTSTTAAGKVDPVDKTHILVAIGILVVGGYALWHWNMARG